MKITIRRVQPTDADPLSRFYGDLSPESLHARFLGGTRGVTPGTSRAFCTLDHMHDEGLVALLDGMPEPRIVGHVCLFDAGTGEVEIGIAVADACQGHGIGRQLFEAAIAWATERGFKAIKASCYMDNSRVLALLSSAPYGARTGMAASGTVNVTIPLSGPLPALVETWPEGALAALAPRRTPRRRLRRRDQHWRIFWLPRPSVPTPKFRRRTFNPPSEHHGPEMRRMKR
jgi:GNAT superfamily N-acetyltransferase